MTLVEEKNKLFGQKPSFCHCVHHKSNTD